MPVFKQGDRYTYIAPTPHPCPLCGVSIVVEYGHLDAAAYAQGWVLRHLCPEEEVEPLNQRQWLELQTMNQKPLPPPPRQLPSRRLPAQRLDEAWLI